MKNLKGAKQLSKSEQQIIADGFNPGNCANWSMVCPREMCCGSKGFCVDRETEPCA